MVNQLNTSIYIHKETTMNNFHALCRKILTEMTLHTIYKKGQNIIDAVTLALKSEGVGIKNISPMMESPSGSVGYASIELDNGDVVLADSAGRLKFLKDGKDKSSYTIEDTNLIDRGNLEKNIEEMLRRFKSRIIPIPRGSLVPFEYPARRP